MRMSGQKKHFYVVVKGRYSGIYTRWSGAGGAEEQVKGFVGAVYRGLSRARQQKHTTARAGKTSLRLAEVGGTELAVRKEERPYLPRGLPKRRH